MNQRIVVLGANGFIGSHLTDALSRLPNTTIGAVDRFSKKPVFNLTNAIEIHKVDFFEGGGAIKNALKNADYVFHCFSSTTPYLSDENPYLDVEMLRASIEIFEASAKAGVKKIVFISSGGAIYGDSIHTEDLTEQTMPHPVSPYGICKLAIEHYLEYFKRKYDVDFVVYRLTNPYGPRQSLKKGQGVIPAFIDNALNDRELVVYGDGSATRDFVYIDDAVRMIESTFAKSSSSQKIYNVGKGDQASLNEIISTLESLLNKKIKVTYKEPPKTFLQTTNISIDKFSSQFGMPEMTSLNDGIAKILQHLTSN